MIDRELFKHASLVITHNGSEFLHKMRATKQATAERAANAIGFLKSALEIPELS